MTRKERGARLSGQAPGASGAVESAGAKSARASSPSASGRLPRTRASAAATRREGMAREDLPASTSIARVTPGGL